MYGNGIVIRTLSVVVDDDCALVEWHDRADVLTYYPDADPRCGFEVYVPCRPCQPAYFHIEEATGIRSIVAIKFPQRNLATPSPTSLYKDFISRVNAENLSILEIGSRIVGPMSKDNREVFSGASRYIGLDIHPSPTVDIVGDVHELSELVGRESVDALYSLSVLEHLAMPWIVAREMNRTLKLGGLVFHSTVHSWPLHEQPNDFWRFSDEGL